MDDIRSKIINLETLRNSLISSPRKFKILLMMLNDIYCFSSPFLIAYILKYFSLRSDYQITPVWNLISELNLILVFLITLLNIFIIFLLSGYKSFFRYSNESMLNASSNPRIVSLFLYTFGIVAYFVTSSNNLFISISSAIGINLIILLNILITRSLAFSFIKNSSNKEKICIIIYGAGQAGREVSAYLGQNDSYKIIGFIDDNKNLKNFKIHDKKVFGGFKQIKKIKKNYPDLLIILSIVNINSSNRKKLISNLEEFEVAVKTIPEGYGSLTSKMEIQNLDVNDLIERNEVELNEQLIEHHLKNKNILITGAGGSIGSEISLKIARLKPNKLINIDFSEYNLYKLKNNLDSLDIKEKKFILLDVSNTKEIEKIIKRENIEIIYHAAAYKHVPILENKNNFKSAIENNFFNTFNLCEIASRHGVEYFTLISTDKAVNPTNLMGATKRLAELSLQGFHREQENKTKFSMVRFGNVLNSSGSVVPLFWNQISSGGPVTVTHEEINRFFMTIEEAASLVIQSSSISKGGEVFLLDMGDPIKIKDLAERMIKLSGNSINKKEDDNGIRIVYSGLRPGEKLFEELLLSNNPQQTEHKKIKKGVEKSFDLSKIFELKNSLYTFIQDDNFEESNKLISSFVDGYKK